MMHDAHSPAERRSNWYQWSFVGLGLGTFLFGAWGQWIYDTEHHPDHADPLSVIYHSFQLFVLHGVHLDHPVPWQLHVGRILSLLLVFTAAWLTYVKFFRQEMLQMWLRWPWRREHVLICGLGQLGLRMALDGRKRGRFVVAIESELSSAIDQARRGGVLVLEGDACDLALLRKARVSQAEFVVAACPDHVNVAVAAQIGTLVPSFSSRSYPLLCRLFIRDVELRRLLARDCKLQSSHQNTAGYRINFQDLHVQDTAARQCLRVHLLDFQPIGPHAETLVHLVVIGFGPMGQSLALQAARIGHFANSVTKGHKLRLTVVDCSARQRAATFRARYPQIDSICELIAEDAGPEELLDLVDALSQDAAQTQRLVTNAVCFERGQAADDRENLRIGMELARRAADRPVQTLVYQSTRGGGAAIISGESTLGTCWPHLHAFGMLEDIFCWDVLLHEEEDRIARALHEDFQRLRSEEQPPPAKNPGWEELSDNFKDSNRHAADHISTKLRALGYHHAPLDPNGQRIAEFPPGDKLLLAKMEHLRWCAERSLLGFTYGAVRDDVHHPLLIEWDSLTPQDQQKDLQQVDAMIRALYMAGRGVYR